MVPEIHDKPNFNQDHIIDFCRENFEIEVNTLKELPSYIDQNYLITDNNDQKFVFKIFEV